MKNYSGVDPKILKSELDRISRLAQDRGLKNLKLKKEIERKDKALERSRDYVRNLAFRAIVGKKSDVDVEAFMNAFDAEINDILQG